MLSSLCSHVVMGAATMLPRPVSPLLVMPDGASGLDARVAEGEVEDATVPSDGTGADGWSGWAQTSLKCCCSEVRMFCDEIPQRLLLIPAPGLSVAACMRVVQVPYRVVVLDGVADGVAVYTKGVCDVGVSAVV